MTVLRSKLGVGRVYHKRHAPKVHSLSAGYGSLLVDLDELPRLGKEHAFFSLNAFNLTSLRTRDFGAAANDLKQTILDRVQTLGPAEDIARVEMLTCPRVLGFAFNPITVFFCRDGAERLQAVVFEVNSTFGERRHYAFLTEDPTATTHQFRCDKSMRVSPFNRVEGEYRFRLSIDGSSYRLGIQYFDQRGLNLTAGHTAAFKPITDGALVRHFGAVPFTMLATVFGIHWHALRLWLKGVKFVPARQGARSSGGSAVKS